MGVTNVVKVVVAGFVDVVGLKVVDAFFVVDCGTFLVTVRVEVEVENLVLVLEAVLVAVALKVLVRVAVTGMILVVVLE